MTILIAIAVVAGLAWGTWFVLRGSLMAGCLTYLLVNSCFGYYFYSFQVGGSTMTLDRPILVLLAVCYVIRRGLGRNEPKPFRSDEWAVIALLGWLAFRTFSADWRGPFIEGQIPPFWYLLAGYISPFALYWFARNSPLNERTYGIMQRFFLGLGIYLTLTGICEVTGQWWAVFPKHIADPNISQHFGRARGPMVNSIPFGFVLSISLLCAWNCREKLQGRARLLMLGLAGLMMVGLFISQTRCVWLGVAVAIMTVLGLTLNRRQRNLAIGTLVTVGVLVLATKWDKIMSWDGGRVAEHARESSEMRAAFTYVGWLMFQDNPLCGCGLGQYVKEQIPYMADRQTGLHLVSLLEHPLHNLFLGILVETGLIGFLLLMCVLFAWARTAYRLFRHPAAPQWARLHGMLVLAMLGVYVSHAVFHPIGHTYIVQLMMFFVTGISSGLLTKADGYATSELALQPFFPVRSLGFSRPAPS